MTQTVSAADSIGFKSTATPAALTLSAAVAANDYICYLVINDGSSGGTVYQNVASIANSAGLTFTRRWTFENDQTTGGTSKNNIELWTAKASGSIGAGLFNITPTMTAAIDGAAHAVWTVTGCDVSVPFDANGSLPARAVNTTSSSSAPAVSGVSTTNANTVLFAFYGSPNSGLPTPPAGWTTLVSLNYAAAPVNFADMVIGYKVVTATQSALSITFSNNEIVWQLVADAMQGTAPPVQKSQAIMVG